MKGTQRLLPTIVVQEARLHAELAALSMWWYSFKGIKDAGLRGIMGSCSSRETLRPGDVKYD